MPKIVVSSKHLSKNMIFGLPFVAAATLFLVLIFEGPGHGEFLNMYIPESRQAAHIIAAFFDARLK